MPVAQGLKSMHPSAKMCTLSAGCTLDHEHRDNERFSVQCIHNGFMKLNFAFLAVGITLVYERYKLVSYLQPTRYPASKEKEQKTLA